MDRTQANMSLTYRFFLGDKRLSTAVMTKKGEFLQVYPNKFVYSSESAWRDEWMRSEKPRVETTLVESKKALPEPAVMKEDWTVSSDLSFTAPPGTYYIGDLCYALSDKIYDDIFGGLGGYDPGLYKKKDSSDFFLVDGTAYGDGCYQSSDGKEFGVDAGIIGIVPLSLVATKGAGGHFYTFKEAVKCKFGGGYFRFISGYDEVIIDTTGNDDAY